MILTGCLVLYILQGICATTVYVIPDDLVNNSSCPFQPCATLSEVCGDHCMLTESNIEYLFLPGEYRVTTEIVIAYADNVSFHGIAGDSLPPVVVKFHSSLSQPILITTCNYVSISNIIFKRHSYSECRICETNVQVTLCVSCKIANVTFYEVGLQLYNFLGMSYLEKITMNLNNKLLFSSVDGQTDDLPGIILSYVEPYNSYYTINSDNIVLVTELTINGTYNYNTDFITTGGFPGTALRISMSQCSFGAFVNIKNSVFTGIKSHKKPMVDVALLSSTYSNQVFFVNCIFEKNVNVYDSQLWRAVIYISMPDTNVNISFVDCNFYLNRIFVSYQYYFSSAPLLSFEVTSSNASFLFSIVTIHNAKFNQNYGQLIYAINDGNHNTSLIVSGMVTISHNTCTLKYKSVFNVQNFQVAFNGVTDITNNSVYLASILSFDSARVYFHGVINFSLNKCSEIITLKSQYTYIIVLEYTNISFTRNSFVQPIFVDIDNDYYKLNPLCLFQYTTLRNTSEIPTNHYNVILNKNSGPQRKTGMHVQSSIQYYTSHCRWLPNTVFYGYHPKIVNQQIIHIYNQTLELNHSTKVCYCPQVGVYNCSIDTLGPVYPGQRLQVGLSVPYTEKTIIVYAETHATSLPKSACRIANQNELVNILTNSCKMLNFTIISNASAKCELFLTTQPDIYKQYEAFYVKLLPCPVGFLLLDGLCNCDPQLTDHTLPVHVQSCDINEATIQRPASSWIYSDALPNKTKYFLSTCPMGYCLPHSSSIDLTTPDLQCQFRRSGLLCSQCQHGLSMVFGSSRCMKCTNVHILITLIVIVAGVVLVVLLYLLNLTVTNGTINGIIFYANIVGINDSVFLKLFKPLKLFISFTNLDLGIETCYYNGMDSYAKMWLRLFFPLYLIMIATFIIIASRYSYRIQRLTYTRSLPVLATLFLLSYTSILRAVSTVLFSYSTITELPSGYQNLAWSIDASLSLFSAKHTILFIICLVLFLLLVPFNIILLFTRYLLQFKAINRFIPILDAFQGSYKVQYYYWVAIYIIVRDVLFAATALPAQITLIITTFVLLLLVALHGYIHPNKNKSINIQELVLLVNLTMLYAAAAYHNSLFSLTANIIISFTFFHFVIIVLYHFLTFTCHCNIAGTLIIMKEKLAKMCYMKSSHQRTNSLVQFLNIPDRANNYSEYREGLVSDDFNNTK